ATFAAVMRRGVMAHGPRALLAAPLVWVATELGRGHVPYIGFPWVLLGYSQATVLPIAQFASLFGIYGVSLLVGAVGTALAVIVVHPSAPKSWSAARFGPAAIVLALVVVAAVWGAARVARSEWTSAGVPIRIGLVQGNVDQSIKWDPASSAAIFRE